jgi:hypothetical protein
MEDQMSKVGDKACEILRRTKDGDDLAPRDLYLVECAVNSFLTDEGMAAFEDLHRSVTTGQYRKPWLFEVENLTLDHQGYVYWRDSQVEHYTFWNEDSRWRLQQFSVRILGPACRRIEARGEKVSGVSVSKELDAMRNEGIEWE